MKRCLVFFILLGMVFNCSAKDNGDFGNTIFYKGDIIFNLEKTKYSPGEEIKTDILVANMENFPLYNNYLIIDIVRGGSEHVYPSQMSENDSILYETAIETPDLPALSEGVVPFLYRIPSDMKGGDYRLEIYFKNERGPIVGIPHIFMTPRYVSFTITGNGDYPGATILRTKTVIENTTGPMGVGINSTNPIKGNIYIQSNSKTELTNLRLNVLVCEWDDTTCKPNEMAWNKDFYIDTLAANTQENVSIEFATPTKHDAYSVRFELFDQNNRTISLYRNRFITMGEAAKIRKLAINKQYYETGEKGTIRVLIGASPDHYSYPTTNNVNLQVYLKDKNTQIFNATETISNLSGKENSGITEKEFQFTAPKELRNFEVCARIELKGKEHEKYCFNISQNKTQTGETTINADWGYNEKTGTLDIKICAKDSTGLPTNAKTTAALYIEDKQTMIGAKDVTLNPCGIASIKTEKGEYLLTINNLETNKQHRFNAKTTTKEIKKAECGDKKCEDEEKNLCCNDCGCEEGTCEQNTCKTKTTQKEIEPKLRPITLTLETETNITPDKTTTTTEPEEKTETTETQPEKTDTATGSNSQNTTFLIGGAILIIAVGILAITRRKK